MMPDLRQIATRWIVALPALFVSVAAWSWGAEGHRVVADLVSARMTPEASAEVARLLALEPGATLASISTWPDEVRSGTTGKWHYVNFGKDDCHYDEAQHCPGGQCVVGAINKQIRVLGSHASDSDGQ